MTLRLIASYVFLGLASFGLGVALLACQPPPFVPPTACKTDGDCAGTQRCDQGACKLLPPPTTTCKPKETRTCFTGTQGCTKDADQSYKCVGLCKAGLQTCTDQGLWDAACSGEILALAQEDCTNGKDDNCDGKTDKDDPTCVSCKDGDSRACYSGTDATRNRGICKEGKQTCKAGVWAACEGEVLPAAQEDCTNAKDDNCDGKTDYDDPTCKQKTCQKQEDCAGLGKSICLFPRGKADGLCVSPCDAQTPCPQGLVCKAPLIFGPSYCLRPVQPGEKCLLNDLTKVCPPPTECGLVSGYCDKFPIVAPQAICLSPDQCPKDYACVLLPMAGRCLRTCTQDGDCGAGIACVKVSNPFQPSTAICLPTCTSDAGCGPDTSCRKEAWADPTRGHCLPKGNLAPWDACHPNSRNCGPGLRCFIDETALSTRPIGYCAPETCSVREDCKNSNAICADYDRKRTCLIPCKDNASACSTVPDSVCRLINPSQAPFCSP